MQRTWEEIDKVNICNKNFHSKSKIKNALERLAFNLIKINEPRCITLFVVSGSIKKLFSIDYINI